MLGGILDGIRVEDREFAGGPFDWLTPFSVMCGLGLVVGYALHRRLLARHEDGRRRRAPVAPQRARRCWRPDRVHRAGERVDAARVSADRASAGSAGRTCCICRRCRFSPACSAIVCWRGIGGSHPTAAFYSAVGLFVLAFVGLAISVCPISCRGRSRCGTRRLRPNHSCSCWWERRCWCRSSSATRCSCITPSAARCARARAITHCTGRRAARCGADAASRRSTRRASRARFRAPSRKPTSSCGRARRARTGFRTAAPGSRSDGASAATVAVMMSPREQRAAEPVQHAGVEERPCARSRSSRRRAWSPRSRRGDSGSPAGSCCR